MKEKLQRDDVVLTARISKERHTIARAKLFAQRKSFQDLISAAVEKYIEGDEGLIAPAPAHKAVDPIELIAARVAALVGIPKGIATTPGPFALSELKLYLQDIRNVLSKIDRILENTTGESLASAIGSRIQEPEPATERDPARDAAGDPENTHQRNERGGVDSQRAIGVIEDTESVVRAARESIESTGRPSSGGQVISAGRKYPRKKAG